MSHGEKRNKIRKGTFSFFDKTFEYIYNGLKTGVVGALFTSYNSGETENGKGTSKLRAVLSSAFNDGFTVKAAKRISDVMMMLRLRVYGMFLATFGIYTFLFELFDSFLLSESRQVFGIIFAVVLIFCSVPLILSEKHLIEAMSESALGRFISKTAKNGTFEHEKTGVGRVSHGFILGVAAGSIGYFTSPYKVAFGIILLVLIWVILSKPELGIAAVSFLIPFISAKLSIVLLLVTAAAFSVKVIRGKRYVCFETVDAAVLGVLLTVLLGGIVALHPGAHRESLTYVLLIIVYFLTVNLLKTKAWLDCTTVALVFGLSVSCLFRTVGNVGDVAFGNVSANLADMFGGSLTGQLLSGDESITSVISVTAIPLTVSLFMRPAFRLAKGYALAALAVLLFPCISNGTFCAFLAVIGATLLLLLMYSRRSLYIVLAGATVIPAASLLFPSAFARVSAYVGNEVSEAASLRAPLWENTLRVMSDFLFGGIGFGKESFSGIASMISSTGESIPHSYNTYLQLWVETGVFGVVIFLAFAWLLVSSAFTMFKRVDNARKNPALRTRGLRINSPDSLSGFTAEKKGTNIKLSVNQYSVSRRIGAAAPLCSILGMLVYGCFDYIWYDEKVFLMFWLTAGLCSAYVRSARKETDDIELSYLLREESECSWETDIN